MYVMSGLVDDEGITILTIIRYAPFLFCFMQRYDVDMSCFMKPCGAPTVYVTLEIRCGGSTNGLDTKRVIRPPDVLDIFSIAEDAASRLVVKEHPVVV